MTREHSLGPGEIVFLTDGSYTVGVVKAAGLRHVFIETDKEELVQFLEGDDLLAASCFSAGLQAREAIQCMLHLVSRSGMPLLALPKDHPATKRLPLVLSAGERIRLTACIVPGTHPEQDVLCGRGGLDGLVLTGTPGGVTVEGDDAGIAVERAPRL